MTSANDLPLQDRNDFEVLLIKYYFVIRIKLFTLCETVMHACY